MSDVYSQTSYAQSDVQFSVGFDWTIWFPYFISIEIGKLKFKNKHREPATIWGSKFLGFGVLFYFSGNFQVKNEFTYINTQSDILSFEM